MPHSIISCTYSVFQSFVHQPWGIEWLAKNKAARKSSQTREQNEMTEGEGALVNKQFFEFWSDTGFAKFIDVYFWQKLLLTAGIYQATLLAEAFLLHLESWASS